MSNILKDKIALVTGSSRGIGAEVAKRFAAEGAHVILTARNIGALEEVDDEIQANGGKTTIVALDLRDGDKIDQLGGVISERFGKLDILVGNAAMLGDLAPVNHVDPKVWDKIITTNLTANYRLIRSFDPLLRSSDAGRAVFVTTSSASRVVPFWGAYAASKSGLESLVKHYASEIEKTNIKVNLLNPGGTATKMLEQAFPGADMNDFKSADDDRLIQCFVDLVTEDCNYNGEVVSV